MADVQLENGYFKIANELFEQFFIRDFSVLQLKILLLLVRCSYGFNKKIAIIKPQRFFELAYVYKGDIKKELQFLQLNKVILCNFEQGSFKLNKNFDEWKIPYHKLFNPEELINLKRLNLVSPQLTSMLVENEQTEAKVAEISIEEVSGELTSSSTTNNGVSPQLTSMLVENEQTEAEKASSEGDTNLPKYMLNTSKDILNTSIYKEEEGSETSSEKIKNVSLLDPYFNPIKTNFEKEYKNIFNTPCYLNNPQLLKLLEIAAVIPDFIEIMPEMLTKLSKIRFEIKGKKEKQTVGLRWLIDDGNWAGVLRGEFDQYIEEEGQQEGENDGYTY